MTELAEKAVTMVERRLSRRGFLATCGKLTLGLGMAVLGVAGTARRAEAVCCPSPSCDTSISYPCPPGGAGCPSGCASFGIPPECCDGDVLHRCHQCICGGATCYCEEILGGPC